MFYTYPQPIQTEYRIYISYNPSGTIEHFISVIIPNYHPELVPVSRLCFLDIRKSVNCKLGHEVFINIEDENWYNRLCSILDINGLFFEDGVCVSGASRERIAEHNSLVFYKEILSHSLNWNDYKVPVALTLDSPTHVEIWWEGFKLKVVTQFVNMERNAYILASTHKLIHDCMDDKDSYGDSEAIDLQGFLRTFLWLTEEEAKDMMQSLHAKLIHLAHALCILKWTVNVLQEPDISRIVGLLRTRLADFIFSYPMPTNMFSRFAITDVKFESALAAIINRRDMNVLKDLVKRDITTFTNPFTLSHIQDVDKSMAGIYLVTKKNIHISTNHIGIEVVDNEIWITLGPFSFCPLKKMYRYLHITSTFSEGLSNQCRVFIDKN